VRPETCVNNCANRSLARKSLQNNAPSTSTNAVKVTPFYFQALIRCESENSPQAEQFLLQCKQTINKISAGNNIATRLFILGPMPSPMPKKAGRFRFQLLLQADERSLITQTLVQAQPVISALPEGRSARWSIDIDPLDFV
jgi:primosomal protein N' (replication factor Y)